MSKELIRVQPAQEPGCPMRCPVSTTPSISSCLRARKAQSGSSRTRKSSTDERSGRTKSFGCMDRPKNHSATASSSCRRTLEIAIPHDYWAWTLLCTCRHEYRRKQSARRPHHRNHVVSSSAQNVAKLNSETTYRWLLLRDEYAHSAYPIRTSRRAASTTPSTSSSATGELT